MSVRKMTLFLLSMLSVLCVGAAKEPKKVGAAKKTVATILVYKEGQLLGNGVGVYSGAGELLASYSLFFGADSAVAITPDGVSREVQRIVGVNDIYDCIKLRTASDKKLQPLPLATAVAAEGETLYLVTYGAKKSGTVEPLKVAAVSKVGGTPYYTFSFPMQERYLSAPVVNGNGELVALMQSTAPGDTINSYAVGASLAAGLTTTSLTYGSELFRKINIPVALPASQNEALTTLYLLQGYAYTDNRDRYLLPLDEYRELYPDSYEGCLMRAEYLVLADSAFDGARREWNRALKLSDKPDDVHYNISKVYATMLSRASGDDEQQLLDSAIVHIAKAVDIKPEPLYVQRKAELLYADGDYASSFESYWALSQTNLSGPYVFVAASRCKEALEEWDAAIVCMDSAVNAFGADADASVAPYIIHRAMLKQRAKRYREAVLDYNTYAELREGQLNANFYYSREQAEYEARMYQQAIDDIEMALYLQPDELVYLVEKGRLCYKVKLIDEAIAALTRAAELANDNPDAHYMLARCYMVKGEKAAAKASMLRAKELGHFDADARLQDIEAMQ